MGQKTCWSMGDANEYRGTNNAIRFDTHENIISATRKKTWGSGKQREKFARSRCDRANCVSHAKSASPTTRWNPLLRIVLFHILYVREPLTHASDALLSVNHYHEYLTVERTRNCLVFPIVPSDLRLFVSPRPRCANNWFDRWTKRKEKKTNMHFSFDSGHTRIVTIFGQTCRHIARERLSPRCTA